VARDSGGTSQELIELIVSDAALALLISLDEAVEDEVVEGGMLVGARVLHGLLNETNVLLLGVILNVVQTDIASWDLWDGAHDVSIGPLDKLVKAESSTRSSTVLVKLVKEQLVVHCTRDGITDIERGKTIAARDGRHLGEELVKLLGVDQAVLVSVHITEREGKEAVQFTLLLGGARLHCGLGPGFEGLLIVTPVISSPRACCKSAD